MDQAETTGAEPAASVGGDGPLSPAAARRPIHRRVIDCWGYQREDGLFDIEGRLTDTKSYAFDNRYRGRIEPGDPIHAMHLRLTLNEDFEIVEARARTEKSPFAICPEITPNYDGLAGTTIRPGWLKRAQAQIGGVQGCTHLTELLGRMATVAYQSIMPFRRKKWGENKDGAGPHPLLDSCYAFRADGPVIQDTSPDRSVGPEESPPAD